MTPSQGMVLAEVQVVPDLPPLSWLAEVSENTLRLYCGNYVDVKSNGFFEGCWSDQFSKFNFDEVANVFGSGAKIQGDSVLFVTPSHTLEVLYVLDRSRKLTVSNSLPFLIQFEGLELEYDFDIGARFASILKGIVDYERVLFKSASWSLYRIAYENFVISNGRLVTRERFKEDLPFKSFQEYKGHLLTTVRKTLENGSSPQRKVQFSPVATCSSGYDSPACAALAASLGCDKALTLRTARGGKVDSGRDIALKLGMEVLEFDREAKSRNQAFGEAEFLASGMGGEDYVFVELATFCSKTIVVNGLLGGTMWQLNFLPTSTVVRKDCSGSSLTENRLRNGFVLLPIPFIGCTHHDQILRIGKSAEMKAYRVGGGYDRPIPRRILEESGIPRHYFGQVKKGYSIAFQYSSLWWSRTSLSDLKKFERSILTHQSVRRRYLVTRVIRTMTVSGYYLTQKICRGAKIGWLPRVLIELLVRDFPVYEHNHPRYGSMAFLWALEKVRSRYPSRHSMRPGLYTCLSEETKTGPLTAAE